MSYFRIMALDIGKVRIGIALSDLMQLTASPFESYTRVSESADLKHICDIIEQKEVKQIVCGLPVSLDGTENKQAIYCRKFAKKLGDICNLPIEFCDEKLTTVEADEILIAKKTGRQDRKKVVDKLAATLILDDFLKIKEKKTMEESKKELEQDEIFDEVDGDIVDFELEDGTVVPFEHICTIEYKDKDYYLFSPLEDTDDVENEEVAIFTIEKDGDEMIYQMVEDQEIVQAIYKEYVAIMEEQLGEDAYGCGGSCDCCQGCGDDSECEEDCVCEEKGNCENKKSKK